MRYSRDACWNCSELVMSQPYPYQSQPIVYTTVDPTGAHARPTSSYMTASKMNSVDRLPAYLKLLEHRKAIDQVHLKDLLNDTKRTDALTFEHAGVTIDFSRQVRVCELRPVLTNAR